MISGPFLNHNFSCEGQTLVELLDEIIRWVNRNPGTVVDHIVVHYLGEDYPSYTAEIYVDLAI